MTTTTKDVIHFYGADASILEAYQTPNWYAIPINNLSDLDLADWLKNDYSKMNPTANIDAVDWLEVATLANQKLAYRSAYCGSKISVVERCLRNRYKR